MLSSILSLPHWNLMQNNIHQHTHTQVPLWFFITLWNFELILSLIFSLPHWNLSYSSYENASSFWARFWASPTGMWAIPCKTTYINTHKYLYCSSSLYENLSSFWARFWAFSTGFWAIRCKITYKHTSTFVVLHHYLQIWDHFELDVEPSPLEFELSHAKQIYAPKLGG